MKKYDIYLPIVDTSKYNFLICEPNDKEYVRIRKNIIIQRRDNNE